jgi:anti-sigma regulatory factor (Ser/Thr protein kinase)
VVCTSADGRGLVHHGLLHPPAADLAEILAPLVAQRLAGGQPVLAVLPAATAAKVQSRLPTLAGLHTADAGAVYRRPGRVLAYYAGWVAETSPGEPVTIVAAPDPGGDDPYRAAWWRHIDALTSQALAPCNLTLICAYPNDPATATAIRQAHPSLLNGAVTASPDYLPTDQFLARHPLPAPSELGSPQVTHILDHPSELAELRQVVRDHVSRAGLTGERGEDFVLAVTEVASNAVEHGVPPVAVCLWTTATSIIFQITDNGHFTEPLAGLLPPPANQSRGRGLWMAHQLCDQLYLWPQPTTIRLHIDRSQATASRPTGTRS